VFGEEFGRLHKKVSDLWNPNRGNGNGGNKMAHDFEMSTATMLTCEFLNII
jgi:hypothetical protein